MTPFDYHGCITGDCPHPKFSICIQSLVQLADDQYAKIGELQTEVNAAHRLDDAIRHWVNSYPLPMTVSIAVDEYRQVREAAQAAQHERSPDESHK